MKPHLTPSRMPAVARQLFTVLFLALALSVIGLSLSGWRVSAGAKWFGLMASPAALSGTKTVCPVGCDYPTLTAAVADIQAQGLGGALLLELQASYVSTSEAFPLTFTNLTGASAVNTVTVRPVSGATNLAITSANTTATVDLNNANYLTIDGRAGGAGTAKQLIIENTSSSGVALRFINEASNNTVKFAVVRGVNTSATSGVVVFSTTTGANGNDNNTLDNCGIADGASNAVYALGTTTNPAQNNSGNTVSNCNIFNFYAATAIDAAGVRLDGGNTDWTITGNSFYQTASRAAVGANVRAIYVNNTSGNNFTVTGNFIGGKAASAGSTAWTTTGTTAAYLFQGILLNVGATTPSSVQGNTVKNLVWTSNSTASTLPGVWSGIYVQAGAANVGTVTGNTIGSGTGTGSVSITTSATTGPGTSFGIGSGSSGTVAIANNTIGSVTVNGSATTISASLVGIQVTAGTNTISGNTVGSTATANSLNAATSSTSSTTGQQVTGILSSSSTSASITGNTVANLKNNYASTSTAGQIRGIVTSAGVNTITGNTVRNLSTTSQNVGTATLSSVLGIIQTSTTAGQTVSQNTVHSSANTAASAAVSVTGIYFEGPTSGTNLIARNLVHSLAVSSSSASSVVSGMFFNAGTFTAQNNMVRVGLDAGGTSTAGAATVRGIRDQSTTAGRNFYHNSVYVGGSQTSAANTFAFTSAGATNARAFQNNIFVNARSNAQIYDSDGDPNGFYTGKHYAVQYGGSGVNPTGLTASNNIFLASGTIGGVLGNYSSADQTTLAAWQSATGKDAASAAVDPHFVIPTGTASTVNLHLQASSQAEGVGILVAAVTDDYDGETRSSLTPTDIGADAGNYTFTTDYSAPIISYTPLASTTSTANRTLTATITDNIGVAGGANLPRLYFKKSKDADVFGGNTSAANGWKFVTASNASSPYDFTIDYSIIFNSGGGGGSVASGDTIQYFVAQDAVNNLGSSPAGAGSSANPPVQNVNAHGGVNSYDILKVLSSTNSVCASGCDYTSLTGALGVFSAINNSVLTGNIVINISGDLTEDGTNALNQWTESGAGNYTVTIQPSDGTMKTISGAVANGMIRLNGADRVTIDGRFNNAGRWLTFRNTNTNNPTFTLLNDASNNTIRSSVIEGATTSFGNGVIFFSTGATTGNDNNTVADNQLRDRSDAAGVPYIMLFSGGTSAAIANSNNIILNNEIFNWTANGIYFNPANGNESWTIQGNTIYQTAARTSGLTAIELNSKGTNTITQNTIRDLNTSGYATGITLPQVSNTTVSLNRIYSFLSTNGSTGALTGIQFNGGSGASVTLVNNQISLIPSFTNNQIITGIRDAGASGNTFNAYFNSVLIGGTASGGFSTWPCVRVSGAASTHTARNNICFNNRTGGGANHLAAGNESTAGSYSSNYNLFIGTGETAANLMDFGNGATNPVSFATWQTSTGGDANSQAGNPGGNFTTAMFVNAATGDLHIVPAGNPLVSNTGTPVSGITTDYDNDTRNTTTPDIGSDEFTASSNTAPTITAGATVMRQQGTAGSPMTIATVNDTKAAQAA